YSPAGYRQVARSLLGLSIRPCCGPEGTPARPIEAERSGAYDPCSRSGGGQTRGLPLHDRCAHRCSLRVEVASRPRFVAPRGSMVVTADQRGTTMCRRLEGPLGGSRIDDSAAPTTVGAERGGVVAGFWRQGSARAHRLSLRFSVTQR